VLRAFDKENSSNERVYEMLNVNCLSNSITTAVWSWYAMRQDLLSLLVLASGCFLAIWFRSSIDPVLLGMMLQYLLTLQNMCTWGLWTFG